MENDAKEEITMLLDLLKASMIKNHVSMGVSTSDGGMLAFFDTDTYVETGKMDGFKVSVQDLVK